VNNDSFLAPVEGCLLKILMTYPATDTLKRPLLVSTVSPRVRPLTGGSSVATGPYGRRASARERGARVTRAHLPGKTATFGPRALHVGGLLGEREPQATIRTVCPCPGHWTTLFCIRLRGMIE
jgi:hypothetical protein